MVKKVVVNNETNIVVKKRGRKSKKEKELEISQTQVEVEKNAELIENSNDNNINVIIEDTDNNDSLVNNIEKLLETDNASDLENNEVINLLHDEKAIPKKRGRKPKGGKIIQQVVSSDNNNEVKPNVILHLKCSFKDLYKNSLSENEIQSYNFSNVNQLSYDVINENNGFNKVEQLIMLNENSNDDIEYDNNTKQNKESDIRDIWKK